MAAIKTTHVDGDISIGRNVSTGGNLTTQGKAHIKGSLRVDGWLKADNVSVANKGMFRSEDALKEAYPKPQDGWYAIVGDTLPGPVYVAEDGKWTATGETGGNPSLSPDLFNEDIEEVRQMIQSEHDRFVLVTESEYEKLLEDGEINSDYFYMIRGDD